MADLTAVLALDLVCKDCGLFCFDLLILLEVCKLLLGCDRFPCLNRAYEYSTVYSPKGTTGINKIYL